MECKPTPAYEAAQTRISELIAEIGNQIDEIYSTNSVDSVIAEQDKSNFIKRQTDIISNYRFRDEHDQRDNYINKLERDLELAKSDCDYFKRKYHEAHDNEQKLAKAIEDVAGVLATKA